MMKKFHVVVSEAENGFIIARLQEGAGGSFYPVGTPRVAGTIEEAKQTVLTFWEKELDLRDEEAKKALADAEGD